MCDEHKERSLHKKVKKRYGASIDHGTKAHKADHKKWSRRDFLFGSGVLALGSSLSLGNTMVKAFQPTGLMNSLSANGCDRTLVLIRLDGGNDGLNTVIPYTNDEYYNIRPTIGVTNGNYGALNDEFALPNEMFYQLQPLWNEGRMKIIHNVGYPNPDFSHFRSSDIWATSSASDEHLNTGWIGRKLDQEFPAYIDAPPVIPPALQIGVSTNLLFRADHGNMALAISNPTEFYQIASTGELYNSSNLGNCANDSELTYLRQTANNAFRYSETIREAYNAGSNNVTFPNNNLAEQLGIVARLINGQLGTKIYMVTIGGFDTHANQPESHSILLNNIASAVSTFYQDLDASGMSEDILTMTFSEFGRTIFENGSEGTDHGTGAPIMLFGGTNLGGGFHGTPPTLTGIGPSEDPAFSVDFRSVYATILQDWLCTDPTVTDFVIGEPTETIDGLVPTGISSVGSNETAALLGHNSSATNPGYIDIKYSIFRRGTVRIRILDASGQSLRTLMNEFKERGSYIMDFDPAPLFLPSGNYIYQLDTGGRIYDRPIWW
ncbi:MAG: hypothetical protein ACI8YQ_003140 [Polaribacter sp.]|jgi:uncharacterized protein (DUF1501 family)